MKCFDSALCISPSASQLAHILLVKAQDSEGARGNTRNLEVQSVNQNIIILPHFIGQKSHKVNSNLKVREMNYLVRRTKKSHNRECGCRKGQNIGGHLCKYFYHSDI